jgi:hypothetical protein
MCTIQRNKYLGPESPTSKGRARIHRKTAPPKVAFADIESWKQEYEEAQDQSVELDGFSGNENQDAVDIALLAAFDATAAADAAMEAVSRVRTKHHEAAIKMQSIGRGRAGRKVRFNLEVEKAAWEAVDKPCICCGMAKDPACIVFQTTGTHALANKAMHRKNIGMSTPSLGQSTVSMRRSEKGTSAKRWQRIRTEAVYGHSNMNGSLRSLSESGCSTTSLRCERVASLRESSTNTHHERPAQRHIGGLGIAVPNRSIAAHSRSTVHGLKIEEHLRKAERARGLLQRRLKTCGTQSVAFGEIAREDGFQNFFLAQPSPSRRFGWDTKESMHHSIDKLGNWESAVDRTTSCPRPRAHRGRSEQLADPHSLTAKHSPQFASHSLALQKRTNKGATWNTHLLQTRASGQISRAGVVEGFGTRPRQQRRPRTTLPL